MEAAVERMSQHVVPRLRKKNVRRLSISGWDGLGRRRVLDRAVEALDAFMGREFCDILWIKNIPGDYVSDDVMPFIEARIEEKLEFPRLPDPSNPHEFDSTWKKLRQGPLVVIILHNGPEILPLETLELPSIRARRFGPLISSLEEFIKVVFTTQRPEVRYAMGECIDKDVAEELDSLTDETALEVVRLEARDIAHAITKEKKFSSLDIDRLTDVITECFLYCSLLPAFKFPEEYWRSEGFFHGLGFDDENYSYGISKLLVNAIFSELEERFGTFESSFRAHHLLKIPFFLEKKFAKIVSSLAREQKGKYMVRHSQELKEIVMADWTADLSRISLANNQIEVIHPPLSPPCLPSTSSTLAGSFTNLSTLLLRDNAKLREIPDVVFLLMPNLRVLDLSFTSIQTLPSSISTLYNLRMLSLQGCQELETIDATRFDKLEVLNLWHCPLRGLKRASWRLHNLKTIILVGGAMNLEELNLSLKGNEIFDLHNRLSISDDDKKESSLPRLQKYNILIMYPDEEEEQDKRRRRDSFFQGSQFPYSDIYPQVKCLTSTANPPLSTCTISYNTSLEVFGGNDNLDQLFEISNPEFLSLNNIWIFPIQTQQISKLKTCQINRCHSNRSSFFYGPCCLTQLETIWISNLRGTSIVFDFYPSKYPGDTIPFLRTIYLENCPELKAIFNQRVDLSNLEVMEIKFCCRLEKVFDEEDAAGQMVFPKLKNLLLLELPKLSTICDGQLPSLQKIMVRGCYNLRKLPLPLYQKDADRVKVHGELEWWNNLEEAVKDRTDFKKQHVRVQLKRYPKMWP